MAIKFVTLRMGYGAETLLGHLVLTSDTLHETPQDAIRSLANAFLMKFFQEVYHLNSCCKKMKKKHAYCPGCGAYLQKRAPSLDEFTSWLCSVSKKIADSYEVDLEGWSPWEPISTLLSANREEVLCIDIYGDSLLAAAVDISKIDHPIAKEMAETDSEWDYGISNVYIPDEYRSLVPGYTYNA
jgi:hypothetical protein